MHVGQQWKGVGGSEKLEAALLLSMRCIREVFDGRPLSLIWLLDFLKL